MWRPLSLTKWHHPWNILTCDRGEFAHFSICRGGVSVVSSQRWQALLHYLIIQPTRDSSLFSLCLLPCFCVCFLCSMQHPLPSNSLGGSWGPNWQASRETGEKKEWQERQWQWYKEAVIKAEKTLAPKYIFLALCHVSYFRCLYHYRRLSPPASTPTPLLLPPPDLLFSLLRSGRIKIQLTDVWLTLRHTICSHKLFDHNSI